MAQREAVSDVEENEEPEEKEEVYDVERDDEAAIVSSDLSESRRMREGGVPFGTEDKPEDKEPGEEDRIPPRGEEPNAWKPVSDPIGIGICCCSWGTVSETSVDTVGVDDFITPTPTIGGGIAPGWIILS